MMMTPLGVLTPGPRMELNNSNMNAATPGGGGVVWVPMTPEQLVMATAGPFLSSTLR